MNRSKVKLELYLILCESPDCIYINIIKPIKILLGIYVLSAMKG